MPAGISTPTASKPTLTATIDRPSTVSASCCVGAVQKRLS